MEKQKFPLERILTISAKDYCESVGKKLQDYEVKGIHYQIRLVAEDSIEILKDFVKLVPENAEVVVNYFSYAGGAGHPVYRELVLGASGTALIPKQK